MWTHEGTQASPIAGPRGRSGEARRPAGLIPRGTKSSNGSFRPVEPVIQQPLTSRTEKRICVSGTTNFSYRLFL